jgi:hypothetical protein
MRKSKSCDARPRSSARTWYATKTRWVGGPFALHQDYPYWKNGVADEPARRLTAMVALDAATRENGALECCPAVIALAR